jgi:hypothetical protein
MLSAHLRTFVRELRKTSLMDRLAKLTSLMLSDSVMICQWAKLFASEKDISN